MGNRNKSFLQEKNGNILARGYPLIGKIPIYFRFFLMKASLIRINKKNGKQAVAELGQTQVKLEDVDEVVVKARSLHCR